MLANKRSLFIAFASIGMGLIATPVIASDAPQTIQAVWQPQEIRFQYIGYTTAYNCDALSDKIERILRTVGAAEGVKVSASGCQINRPERAIHVRVSVLSPIPAGEKGASALSANKRPDLLKRLGAASADTTPFAATWETVDLSRNRSLSIEPGDCELIEHLRDRVFPKLRIKVIADDARCTPHQLSVLPPKLVVSALVPVKAADAVAQKSR